MLLYQITNLPFLSEKKKKTKINMESAPWFWEATSLNPLENKLFPRMFHNSPQRDR